MPVRRLKLRGVVMFRREPIVKMNRSDGRRNGKARYKMAMTSDAAKDVATTMQVKQNLAGSRGWVLDQFSEHAGKR
jgi:hypothetical protein